MTRLRVTGFRGAEPDRDPFVAVKPIAPTDRGCLADSESEWDYQYEDGMVRVSQSRFAPTDEAWVTPLRGRPACLDRPDLDWFPRRGAPQTAAAGTLAVCDRCPCWQQCLDEALSAPSREDEFGGTRAGTSGRQRRELRQGRAVWVSRPGMVHPVVVQKKRLQPWHREVAL